MVSEKKEKSLVQELEILNGVEVRKEEEVFFFKGPKGENNRKLFNPALTTDIKDGKIIISPVARTSKRENRMVNTFIAHFKNLMKGVNEGHVYKLKICSGHFPMNVSISGNKFIVKNFIGESVPRELEINTNTKVKINGTEIVVEGLDKEHTSQMAARIEELTKRPGFDTRIFQDGIYLVEKDGKELK